jgi:hypothetical protein
MNTPFTLQVKEKDLILFHKIAIKYIIDGSMFLEKAIEIDTPETTPNEEVETQPETKLPAGLMGAVISHCTCGNCYSKIVRNDRIPWRLEKSQGTTRLIHCKGSVYLVPKDCRLSDKLETPYGYIYETRKDAKTIRAERDVEKELAVSKATQDVERDSVNKEAEIQQIQHELDLIDTNLNEQKANNANMQRSTQTKYGTYVKCFGCGDYQTDGNELLTLDDDYIPGPFIQERLDQGRRQIGKLRERHCQNGAKQGGCKDTLGTSIIFKKFGDSNELTNIVKRRVLLQRRRDDLHTIKKVSKKAQQSTDQRRSESKDWRKGSKLRNYRKDLKNEQSHFE